MQQPITSYYVQLVDDDGTLVVSGFLSDRGELTTPPGRDELSNRRFTADDMPPEVFVRTSIAPNGNATAPHLRDAAAAVAERFGYRVERYAPSVTSSSRSR